MYDADQKLKEATAKYKAISKMKESYLKWVVEK
jgi:hypothetical protein